MLDACWDSCWPPASCVSAGAPQLITERAAVANSWRIGPDGACICSVHFSHVSGSNKTTRVYPRYWCRVAGVSWGRSMLNIELDANLSAFAGPGHWNNPGLLISTKNDGPSAPALGQGTPRRISETQVCTLRHSLLSRDVSDKLLVVSGPHTVQHLRRAGVAADHLWVYYPHDPDRPRHLHQPEGDFNLAGANFNGKSPLSNITPSLLNGQPSIFNRKPSLLNRKSLSSN